MMKIADYKIEHWTTAAAEMDYQQKDPLKITVNDRAATREAIIDNLKKRGFDFISRSEWRLPGHVGGQEQRDWSYEFIAIHHAGRKFRCSDGVGQMRKIESMHVDGKGWSDVGYHYAIDCSGAIYEGVDIRFKGSHLEGFNTGAIGIVLLENMSDPQDGHDYIAKGLSILDKLTMLGSALIPGVQQASLKELIFVLRQYFSITVLGGHNEFPGQLSKEAKLCPGSHGLGLVADLRNWSNLKSPQ